jgi:hypothetical protein
VIKRNNEVVLQLLIRWTYLPIEDASWEGYDILVCHHPQFILEDKKSFEGQGVSGTEDELITHKMEEDDQQRENEEEEGLQNQIFKIWAKASQ